MKYKGKNYNRNLTTQDIAKEVRSFVKKFKGDVFSITTDHNEIRVVLIRSNDNPFLKEVEYGGINHYYINDNEDLTDKAKKKFQEIKDFVFSYNMDDSDSMTDYFHTNFYFSLAVGKFDKPFQITKLKP